MVVAREAMRFIRKAKVFIGGEVYALKPGSFYVIQVPIGSSTPEDINHLRGWLESYDIHVYFLDMATNQPLQPLTFTRNRG